MQTLSYKGEVIGTFYTRAEAVIYCFSNGLVFDSHSRRRNQLLPEVKITGEDQEDDGTLELVSSRSFEPSRENISVDASHVKPRKQLRKNSSNTSRAEGTSERSLPKRGPLDDRRSYPSERRGQVTRRWWK